MPEYLEATGRGPAGRINMNPLLRATRGPLEARFNTDFGFDHSQGLITANVAELRARGVDVDSVSEVVAAAMARLPGVERVFTPATLAAAAGTDSAAMLWRRSLSPRTGWIAIAIPAARHVFSTGRTAQHGTLRVENMHVPIAFLGAGIPAGVHHRVVETVDIAPTLAALLGVRPLQAVDGRVLPEVVGGAAPAASARGAARRAQ
jgi:hypothetical protein